MGRRKPKGDLFGYTKVPIYPHGEDADRIALDMRALSEQCYQARLSRSAALAEVAALMVELEGLLIENEDEAR
ncbi:hypothetical protein [Maricaulis sp.]|jgi:hypothetical protein|uniref:hypothetical protein n=1 Tax=Maricaulis sp. TaxID=1486257 RepID=UPI0026203602|nr:hypothetical protein [Maricaulis sp.]